MNTLMSALLATLTLLAADATTATTRPHAELPEEVVWRHADGTSVFVLTLRRAALESSSGPEATWREYILRSYNPDENGSLGAIVWSSTSMEWTDGQQRGTVFPIAAAFVSTLPPEEPRRWTLVFVFYDGRAGLKAFAERYTIGHEAAATDRSRIMDRMAVESTLNHPWSSHPELHQPRFTILPGRDGRLARIAGGFVDSKRDRPPETRTWDLVLDNNRLRFSPAEP